MTQLKHRPEKPDPRDTPYAFTATEAARAAHLCTVTRESARGYVVTAPDGTHLARITHHKARPLRSRARWKLTTPSHPAPLTAKSGTWYSWLLYALLYPVAVALALLLDEVPRGLFRPIHIRWRTPEGKTALAYRAIREDYRHDPRHLDPRVAYALAVLHSDALP